MRRCLVVVLLCLGCRGAAARRDESLVIFAAASLTTAFGQLADSLMARHPGLRIERNFAGSQVLALQLSGGAVADVFASADEAWMDVVRDSGLVQGDVRAFAANRLVVIMPAGNPGGIATLRDLARRGTKLVLAAPAVPAGRYAREIISRLSHGMEATPGFEEAVLANVVSNEENVKGVVTKVQLGEADAGIVYASDVTPENRGKFRVLDIPGDANVVATYPIAVLRRSRHPQLAREFTELVLSASGQRVLQHNGFLPPR